MASQSVDQQSEDFPFLISRRNSAAPLTHLPADFTVTLSDRLKTAIPLGSNGKWEMENLFGCLLSLTQSRIDRNVCPTSRANQSALRSILDYHREALNWF
jgi:hypothetical protein